MSRFHARCLAMLVLATLPTIAMATAQRTFLRSDGVDNPSCSLAAPCRAFAAAMTATSANGEVIVLDSAGYGVLTISKSVSIIAAPGIYAGITVLAGFDGVTVSAAATDKVLLRGLTINGQGGNNGIHVTSGKETHIEDCTIANLALSGILIDGGTVVHIARTVVRSNGLHGVYVTSPSGVLIKATVDDSTLSSNGGDGFHVFSNVQLGDIRATATRVTASGNGGSGFAASTGGFSTIVTLAVADSIAAENAGNGVSVSGGNVYGIVSGSSLVNNSNNDLAQSGGSFLRSAGDNAVSGRGSFDVLGTLTPNPLK